MILSYNGIDVLGSSQEERTDREISDPTRRSSRNGILTYQERNILSTNSIRVNDAVERIRGRAIRMTSLTRRVPSFPLRNRFPSFPGPAWECFPGGSAFGHEFKRGGLSRDL